MLLVNEPVEIFIFPIEIDGIVAWGLLFFLKREVRNSNKTAKPCNRREAIVYCSRNKLFGKIHDRSAFHITRGKEYKELLTAWDYC